MDISIIKITVENYLENLRIDIKHKNMKHPQFDSSRFACILGKTR